MPEARPRRREDTAEPVAVGSAAPKTDDKAKEGLRKAANATGDKGKKVWWNGFRAVEVD